MREASTGFMKIVNDYIESGILQSYVLGFATPEETSDVEEMARQHEEVRLAIDSFCKELEDSAFKNAVAPPPTVKPLLLSTIDYMERLRNGEKPTFPPALHEGSKIADFDFWLNRDDMTLPPDFKDFHAKIIGYTSQAVTAIIWIKEMAPTEVHHAEFEKFLIVEGSCDITIGDNTHHLKRGDYLSIPLHSNHFVKVTSSIPCKAILQRVAA